MDPFRGHSLVFLTQDLVGIEGFLFPFHGLRWQGFTVKFAFQKTVGCFSNDDLTGFRDPVQPRCDIDGVAQDFFFSAFQIELSGQDGP